MRHDVQGAALTFCMCAAIMPPPNKMLQRIRLLNEARKLHQEKYKKQQQQRPYMLRPDRHVAPPLPPCQAEHWAACLLEDNCSVCKKKFKPLPDNQLTTRTSNIHGTGIFLKAHRPIQKNKVMTLMKRRKSRRRKHSTKTILIDKHYIEPTGPAKFVNHCCKPNSKFLKMTDPDEKERVAIMAERKLNKNEEVTVNYNDNCFDKEPCKCNECQKVK